MPGSEDKILTLIRRLENKVPLFVPGDTTIHPDFIEEPTETTDHLPASFWPAP
jgi:hypothetical protein